MSYFNIMEDPVFQAKLKAQEECLTEETEFGIPELKKQNIWILQDNKGNYQICQGTGFCSTKSYPYSELDGKPSDRQAKIVLKHVKADKLPVKLIEMFEVEGTDYVLEHVLLDDASFKIEKGENADSIIGKAKIISSCSDSDKTLNDIVDFTYDEDGNFKVNYNNIPYTVDEKDIIESVLLDQIVKAYKDSYEDKALKEEMTDEEYEALFDAIPDELLDELKWYENIYIDYLELDAGDDYGQVELEDYYCDNVISADNILDDIAEFYKLKSIEDLTEDMCRDIDCWKFNDFLFDKYKDKLVDALEDDDDIMERLIREKEEELEGEAIDRAIDDYLDRYDH